MLPLDKASFLFELYYCHVDGRRGVQPDCKEARAYRKLLELEEAILLWEEVKKEDKSASTRSLVKKMQEVGFPGTERVQVFDDDSELRNMLQFILKVSEVTRLRRQSDQLFLGSNGDIFLKQI